MRFWLLFSLALAGCNPSAAAVDAGDGGKPLDGGKHAHAADGGAHHLAAETGPPDESMPPTASEEMTARAKHLLEAIAQDNPDLAADMIFPRDGYLAVKDVTDPGKLWEKQVKSFFAKTVHKLHKKKGIERAQFVSFELGHAVVQSVPKKRDWKKPLWKVRHSKLTYTIDGKTQHLDIAEMTGWRGAWYVTRLR